MAGLIDMARAAPPQAGPSQGMPPQGGAPQDPGMAPDDDEQPNVSPEEQAVYDQFIKNGWEIMYPQGANGSVEPKILASLKAGDNPVQSLAATGVELVTQLETSAEAAGAEWTKDPDFVGSIVMGAGQEFLSELAEIAKGAGIHDYSQDEFNAAWIDAQQEYVEAAEKAGKFDKGELQQEFGEISQAKDQGNLDSVLPQLKSDQPAQGAPPAQAQPQG